MKTQEQEKTFTNVELNEKDNFSPEIEFTNIEGTPFTIVKQNNEYFSIIGNHRITETYLNKEICEQETKKITWDRIVQVCWAISEKMENINKQIKTIEDVE